eukprot:scaffold99745_cov14-Prasinocladus_malaysianus.AAC.1
MLSYLENRCIVLALGECRCCYEGSPNASYISIIQIKPGVSMYGRGHIGYSLGTSMRSNGLPATTVGVEHTA